MKVPDACRLAKRLFWGLVLVLGFTGSAHGQRTSDDASPRAWQPPARPVGEQEEPSGVFGKLQAGLSEIFAGGRLQAHVNGAYEVASRRTETETTFTAYGEQARFLTREEFPGGGHVDVGGSLRVWRGLLLGASYTQVSNTSSASITGTVPHPLEVGRDRTASEFTVSLPRRQRATHAYLGWRLSLSDSLDMELSAGATYFSLRQGVVVDLRPAETGGAPYAEIALQADTGEHTRNGIGFNAGIDITYMLTPATHIPQVGIGYFTRVTGGFVSIPLDTDSWRRESVGGIQTGVGLRLRF